MASFAQLNAMAADLPEGKYALPAKDGSDKVYFFEIAKVKGAHRITQLFGSPGDFKRHTMKISWQEAALRGIHADVKKAITFFGKHFTVCGACMSPLTHERSRTCGLGPKCAPKWRVKW